MPNVIKYSTGATPTGCLRKGNMLIGNNTADYGLTFFNGINPPSGGYTIYLNKASGGPSIYCPANDTQLIFITNQIAGASYTTAAQCLSYFAGQTDKLCVNRDYEGIVTDGLVLNLDARFTPSYPQTGSTWYDISGNNNSGSLVNGPTFNSNGAIVFDGVNDYCTFPSNIGNGYSEITTEVTFKPLNLSTFRDWKFILSSGDSLSSSPEKSVFTMGINDMYNNVNMPPEFTGLNLWFGINASNSSRVRAVVDNSIWSSYLQGCALVVDPQELQLNKNITVTGVYDGTITYLYINGELKATSESQPDGVDRSDTGGILTTDTSSKGISSVNESTRNVNMEVYSTKIYNKELSQQEILQNYYQAPIVTDGLVLAVDAGNLVSYESGSTNAYSLTGSVTSTLQNGTAYLPNNGGTWDFDGTNDYLSFDSNSTRTNLGITSYFTFDIWINADSQVYGGDQFGFPGYEPYWGYTMRTNSSDSNTKLIAYLYYQDNNGNWVSSYNSNSVNKGNVGEWVNFVITFDNGLVTHYVNGNAGTSTTLALTGQNPAQNLRYGIIGWNYYEGKFANGKIYNKALTADEIIQNFNAQKSRFGL